MISGSTARRGAATGRAGRPGRSPRGAARRRLPPCGDPFVLRISGLTSQDSATRSPEPRRDDLPACRFVLPSTWLCRKQTATASTPDAASSAPAASRWTSSGVRTVRSARIRSRTRTAGAEGQAGGQLEAEVVELYRCSRPISSTSRKPSVVSSASAPPAFDQRVGDQGCAVHHRGDVRGGQSVLGQGCARSTASTPAAGSRPVVVSCPPPRCRRRPGWPGR